MIPLLNQTSAEALRYGVSLLLQTGALVGLLLLLDLAVGRRIRAALRHGLWMLVVAKLVLPPTLLLPTSAAYWLGHWTLEPHRIHAPAPIAPRETTLWTEPPSPPESYPPREPIPPRLGAPGAFFAFWIAGTAALALWIGIRQRQIHQLIRDSRPAGTDLISAMERAAHEVGLSRIPALRLTLRNHSPAVCGVRRPVILLPQSLATHASTPVLRGILLHELVHLKRLDPWSNLLQIVVQLVWWWNPCAWLANARIRTLREEAVDQHVQRLHGPDAIDSYPSTLVEVARHCLVRPALALGFVGILESSRSLRQRVDRLLQSPPPERTNLGATGWLTVLAVGLVAMPMAFARRVEVVKNPVAAPTQYDAVLLVHTQSPRPYSLDGVPMDGPTLRTRLRELRRQDPRQGVIVRAAADEQFIAVQSAIEAVNKAGITRLSVNTESAGALLTGGPGQAPSPGRLRNLALLEEIRISGLSFDGTPLPAVIHEIENAVHLKLLQTLVKSGLQSVYDSGGLNFVLLSPEPGSADAADIDPKEARVHWRQPHGDLPVSEVLDAVAGHSDRPIRFVIEDHAYVMAASSGPARDLVFTRMFRLDPVRLFQTLANSLERSAAAPANPTNGLLTMLREHFASHGVSLPTPASPDIKGPQLLYSDETGNLFARGSLADLDRIDALLVKLVASPEQVMLEVHFLEMDEPRAIMAGFPLPDGASGRSEPVVPDRGGPTSGSIIRMDRERVARIEREPGIRVLGTPKIITLSGRRAVVSVGTESLAVVDPATGRTNTIPLGPLLDVVPTVRNDGRSFSISVETTFNRVGGAPVGTPSKPLLITKKSAARMLLKDGATVVAGVYTSDPAELPAGEPRRIIFTATTVTLIDPAGNPIHPMWK